MITDDSVNAVIKRLLLILLIDSENAWKAMAERLISAVCIPTILSFKVLALIIASLITKPRRGSITIAEPNAKIAIP
ncbi:MAG: hypothetical protein QXI11_06005, partial [Thermoproteota archaeon]